MHSTGSHALEQGAEVAIERTEAIVPADLGKVVDRDLGVEELQRRLNPPQLIAATTSRMLSTFSCDIARAVSREPSPTMSEPLARDLAAPLHRLQHLAPVRVDRVQVLV
jgi:hypothetical protein